jgi:transcriptional regulator with XRE-family HTH domain
VPGSIRDGAVTSLGAARSLGERIAGARKLHRMTQPQLAHAATISASLLRKIEQGTRPVTPVVWASIARVLDLGEFELAGEARPAGHRVSVGIPHIRLGAHD